MPGLPVVSGNECLRALEKLGINRVRQRGSHVQVRGPSGRAATVPLHDTLDRGLLRKGILNRLDVTVEDFVQALGE